MQKDLSSASSLTAEGDATNSELEATSESCLALPSRMGSTSPGHEERHGTHFLCFEIGSNAGAERGRRDDEPVPQVAAE